MSATKGDDNLEKQYRWGCKMPKESFDPMSKSDAKELARRLFRSELEIITVESNEGDIIISGRVEGAVVKIFFLTSESVSKSVSESVSESKSVSVSVSESVSNLSPENVVFDIVVRCKNETSSRVDAVINHDFVNDVNMPEETYHVFDGRKPRRLRPTRLRKFLLKVLAKTPMAIRRLSKACEYDFVIRVLRSEASTGILLDLASKFNVQFARIISGHIMEFSANGVDYWSLFQELDELEPLQKTDDEMIFCTRFTGHQCVKSDDGTKWVDPTDPLYITLSNGSDGICLVAKKDSGEADNRFLMHEEGVWGTRSGPSGYSSDDDDGYDYSCQFTLCERKTEEFWTFDSAFRWVLKNGWLRPRDDLDELHSDDAKARGQPLVVYRRAREDKFSI